MLEYLKELMDDDYDAFFFLPGEKENTLHIEGSKYKKPGEMIDGSNFGLGNCYHILMFKEDEEGGICNLDLFEGIIGSPLEYISNMIKMDWYGMLCKKTTTSKDFVQNVFDKMQEP